MSLTTSLPGRVRNTSLPKSHALLPLLEAVVNGIQAIDQRPSGSDDNGRIKVTILRSGQDELPIGRSASGRSPERPITGFEIEDNGIGFTPENLRSFETLDSSHKDDLGCRGVGRLLWLKAFDRVDIDSGYIGPKGDLAQRRLKFSIRGEVEPTDPIVDFRAPGSVVRLHGFKNEYRSSAPKTLDAVARETLEHCIWYFLRPGGAPTIVVVDDDNSVSLDDKLKELTHRSLPQTSFKIRDHTFDMTNLCFTSPGRSQVPKVMWCAASRVVAEESLIGKVPGLHGKLRDGDASDDYTFSCYLTSDVLDRHVRSDRTAFDLLENGDQLKLSDEPTMEEIRTELIAVVSELLEQPLAKALQESRERVQSFVSQKAPRYRPVLSHLDTDRISVDPAIGDQELELLLHKELQKLEAESLAEGHQIFREDDPLRKDDYAERVESYLQKLSDINRADLAAYVSRRRIVIDALTKMAQASVEGKYCKEDAVHSLLMPMRATSDDVSSDASNLWILDERLAFHDFLASDQRFSSMPITDSTSDERPDIIATRLAGNPILAAEGSRPNLASIVVVEIKRPMRNDASEDKDPIQQCLKYVKKIREGKASTALGRPIPPAPTVPAYCYVVADLTQSMTDRCTYANLRVNAERTSYFGFNEAHQAYIEVFSFDHIINAATERNRAFFDKLGLPSS